MLEQGRKAWSLEDALARETIDRRALLTQLSVLGLFGVGLWKLADSDLTPAAADHIPMVRALGDLLIPPTDTPGAGSTEIASFVVRAVEAGSLGVALDALRRLTGHLNYRAPQTFADTSRDRQEQALAALDRDVYAGGLKGSGWGEIKMLLTVGYYLSEPGATRELEYELVPGAPFQADIPLSQHPRPLSNSWSANGFMPEVPR